MAEFEAKITGIADLKNARDAFDAFKKQVEQPIKITVDATGFNAIWGNMQRQAQSFGAQAGKQYANAMQNNIKNVKIDPSFVNRAFSGLTLDGKIDNGSLMDYLGADVKLAHSLLDELTKIKAEGGQLQKITFSDGGESFEATIKNANTLVHVMGELQNNQWVTSFKNITTDFSSGIKQAQTEAQKLGQDLDKVSQSFITGTFDANIAKMEQGLMNISNSVSSDLVKKASDAAAEYYKITQEISDSLTNPSAPGALQGQQLADAYKKQELALKSYNNAMIEVRANTQKMLAEGVGARNANQVETWAKNNSKALKQYGDQLTDLANKMRNAQTQGELNGYVNQFKNLKAEITAAGLGGKSFGDQLKNAFVHIGEFTGIYAITSQIRQLPQEMVQEVIKIDTAMTELRKVSTASASEISDYFDQATESARKYGQTIDEVINSTASWTRLGYNLDDAKTLSDASAELALVGSGLNLDSATEGIQAILRGFQMSADSAKQIGNIVNEVGDTSPIDQSGLIQGLERASAVLHETNNTLAESAGLITATTSVTQDATSAGTAWRTVALRITAAKQELEEAGLDTEGMVESTAQLRDYLLQVAGVDILDSTGKNFKSTYKIMEELSKVWGQLNDLEKSGILDKIAGKRGSVAVAATLQNFDVARKAMETAEYGSEGSMDRQLEVFNTSIDASIRRFKVSFQELSTDLINSDLIKGVVDTGTTIIKIIDELVKHIGVLGTALTGLGLAKLLSTAKNGATGIMHISDAISLFSGGAIKNLGDARSAFGLLWDEISVGANGAGDAIVGLLSNINPVMLGITGGLATAFAVYKLWKSRQEEIERNTSRTTASWGQDKGEIEQYKSQYIELNKQLSNANLTEQERIGIKQQLLSLQDEITAKYGDQVKGIDLINGGLQTQLGILTSITAEEAKRNIQDNRQGYDKAKREIEKNRGYRIDNPNVNTGEGIVMELSSSTQSAYNKIFNPEYWENEYGTFVFKGDATQFDTEVRKVMDDLEELKKTANESDQNLIQTAINSAQKQLESNNKILDQHLDNYKAYQEQSIFADGFGDEASEYAKRIKEYNDALLGGDLETVIAKRSEVLDYYNNTISNILSNHEEYADYFNGIRDQIDTSSEALIDWQDIVEHDTPAVGNTFAKSADKIKSTINDLKKLELDSVDIQAILGNPENVNYGLLSELAKLWKPDIDLTKDLDRKAFTDFLAQLGVGSQDAASNIDLVKSSFDDFMKSASASIDTLDKVNASLVNSFKSGGLSARIDAETGELTGDVQTILSAYKKELGDGSIDQLFERTANGITVNRDALRALQAQQENTTKAEFIERIKEAQEHLAMATTDEERQAWQTRLDNVKLLASAYDGATSAYQKWVDAQNMGEAGDQYDTIASTAIKRGKELYDKGLVGTNEFRAIAQLYTDQDLALASIDEVTKAYEDGVGTVKKYFTEGQEGAVAFADKLVELGAATKEGDFYNFEDGINTSDLAEKLGISVDLVEAAFKKLGDYGFDIHFMDDDQLAQFDSLTDKAEEAQEKLKELRDSGAEVGDSKLIDIDLGEIDTVDEMKSALEQLNEVVASPEIDPESAEAYQAIIDALQEKLDLLSQTDIGNEVNFENLDNAYSLLGSLQGRMAQIDSINATSSVDIDVSGDDQVQLVAEQIANLPDDIKKAIGFEVDDDATDVIDKLQNEKVEIPVEYQQPTNTPTTNGGTTTVNVQYSQGDVPTLAPQTVHVDYEPNPIEANVVAVLDKTAVDTYKPEDKKANVVFGKNSSEPDNYQPKDKYATVNYTINVNGESAIDDLPDSGNRYITYHINTIGSAPGKYKGTVSKSAFQSMSHASGTAHANGLSKYGLKHDENSLINELGAEIVVRPSDDSWMIFNNGMPTFAQLRKDDIKIYCVHVQKCA